VPRPLRAGRTRFSDPSDQLAIEDEGGRVALTGAALPVGELVTGIVAALRGRVLPSGEFEVADVCFAVAAPQAPLPSLGQTK
jgi:DNA polymerase delta subunit 2